MTSIGDTPTDEAYIPKPRLVTVDLDELKALVDTSMFSGERWRATKELVERLEGEQA